MTDMQILGWIIAIVAFAAGYGLGHLRGQYVGIGWCTKVQDQIRTTAFLE